MNKWRTGINRIHGKGRREKDKVVLIKEEAAEENEEEEVKETR